jgi:hypothetical protein
MYAILSVLLILAWQNVGCFGLDRYVLRGSMRRLHLSQLLDKVLTRPAGELVSSSQQRHRQARVGRSPCGAPLGLRDIATPKIDLQLTQRNNHERTRLSRTEGHLL